MTSDEIRAAFLSFFAGKGHKVIPSSSLLPQNDPTLLLTSAGMVPMKPYFLGEVIPPSPRLASCQKCFRTTDIDVVGDASHLTFFEMLGNFSVGDYFKKEAISWAWEFVQQLGLPTERLWISVFKDDDESYRYWRGLGIPEGRLVRLGEEHNFWGPAGDSGPCGPCSEIYCDFGEDAGCGRPSCAPGCDCGRFSEVWNLVFTQYNQDKEGRRTPLPQPNIDTGMGLERTAAILQGRSSVYETDLFLPLLERIAALTGEKYGVNPGTDRAMRVIAEHGRGITLLIGDGVMPSNEGVGYVLRRILRRAALFGRRLGLEQPFLTELAEVTVRQMRHVYPEIGQRRELILKVIGLEEERFGETLSTGMELLDEIVRYVSRRKQKMIPGKEAFKLYDTYGFPVELTREIATDNGLSVDMASFEQEMEKQRVRAKASHRFERGEPGRGGLKYELDITETRFTGHDSVKQRSVILSMLVDDSKATAVKEGQAARLILESTPFYGEMGGQVGDTGEIRGARGKFAVTNTTMMPPDIIVHQGRVTGGELGVGEEVEAEVDRERRLDIARNHTATHLLQAALRRVLGEHVQQRGSLVTPDHLRFDFSHLIAMTGDEISQVQRSVNDWIRQNLSVYDEKVPYPQAIREGAIALFGEKYGDEVRVLRIGKPSVSAELCGGTHVSSTGEIGFLQIVGEASIGSGLRRIEAVSGRGAEKYLERRLADLAQIAGQVEAAPDAALARVRDLVAELKGERRQVRYLERELSRRITESLLSQAKVVKGVRILVSRVPLSRVQVLREMSDLLREKLKSVIVVLGTVSEERPLFIAAVTPDLVAKGYHAGDIVKQVAKVTGGGGGGKAALAQAGGRDKKKLDEALRLVESLV